MSSIKQKVEEVLGTSGKGQMVLVSGGSGFVAAWVLNAFLSRGYTVRTTVRTSETAENVKKSHKKYLDQLEFAIVKDITVPGAFDEAVKGVDGVVHTASPFVFEVKDNVKDLLDPAIKGTVGILASIKEHNPKVKRVVITSSFAAIVDVPQGPRPNYIYTEKDWNPVTYEQASNKETPGAIAYCASKTFAEKAAFEFVEKEKPNFTVTTINPPMVYGPAAHTVTDLTKLNTSSADIYRLINGSEKEVPSTQFFVWCDVRDVGEAHALAYETPEAAGERFAVTGGTYTYKEVCDIIRKHFPSKKGLVPELVKEDLDPKETYTLSNEKAQKILGLKFRTLEESIKDQVEEFVEIEKKVAKE